MLKTMLQGALAAAGILTLASLVALATGCPRRFSITEDSAAACSDSIDNDGDLYIDCDDTGCAPFCTGGDGGLLCGNGTCDGGSGEDCTTCPTDCGMCSGDCGDGVCQATETCTNCPLDCGVCSLCGDAFCDGAGGEDCVTCANDCGVCPPMCGDGTCDATETCVSCPGDCTCATCPDGTCDATETCTSCPADCGACMAVCGNSTCEGAETCTSCPADCGACMAVCGNMICEAGETAATCPVDCGGGGDPCCGMGPVTCGSCDAATVACVDMFNPMCCTGMWDPICMLLYTGFCGAICP